VVYNRKAIAPWSLEREQGIESATVDSNIETPQYLQPVVNTGVIDLNGNWIGVRTSDKLFSIDAPFEAIGNGTAILTPQSDPQYIEMTGYSDIFIAIKPSNGGSFAISAVMGPDVLPYANLTPVNAAAELKGISESRYDNVMTVLFNDGNEALTGNVWNIYSIQSRLKDQKLLQFKITNNSGGVSDIEFAYQRIV